MRYLDIKFNKKFSVLCYNVNGISGVQKCNKILERFVYPYKNKGLEILGFQELRLNLESGKQFIKKLPSYSKFLSLDSGKALHESPAKAGVSISLHKSLNAMILDKRVEPGWLMMLKCKMQEKVFVIVNGYLPSDSTSGPYREKLEVVDAHLKKLKCDNIIFMGDFNMSLSQQDCAHLWSSNHQALTNQLSPFLDKWELQDVWHIQNPFASYYTHRNRGNLHDARRIDYIFVSLNFMAYVSHSNIGVSYCSDHSPLHLNFQFNTSGGKRPFIFPVDLCYSDQFRNELIENIKIVKSDNSQADPHVTWELVKSTIRATALRFKSFQSKLCKELVEEFGC